MLEAEIKILCNHHEVCPEVMVILQDMGFTRIKDISDSSVSFDITARRTFHNEKDEQETIRDVFDKCNGRVHQIEITKKTSRSF